MWEKTINRVVLITWARWWLWHILVQKFLNKWYYVLAGIRDLDKNCINKKNLEYIKLDVTKEEDIVKTLEYVEEIWSLKVIINNAAISGWWKIWERNIEVEKKIYDVNFFAPINIMKLSQDILEKNYWILINISSISANVPVPFISTYASSKSALENFMIWAFLEKRKSKIRCLNLKLWPLTKWLCWSSLPQENSKYKSWVKNHLSKIQRLHWYPVEKVWDYIIKYIENNKKFKIKTLWIWANIVVFLSKIIPQPYYQKLIWKTYREIK